MARSDWPQHLLILQFENRDGVLVPVSLSCNGNQLETPDQDGWEEAGDFLRDLCYGEIQVKPADKLS